LRLAAQSDVTLDTTKVTLDVVARDRCGRAITDLAPSDVTILEDGIPQEISSFRRVRPVAPNAAQTTAGAAPERYEMPSFALSIMYV
jgi:hypothetical protein